MLWWIFYTTTVQRWFKHKDKSYTSYILLLSVRRFKILRIYFMLIEHTIVYFIIKTKKCISFRLNYAQFIYIGIYWPLKLDIFTDTSCTYNTIYRYSLHQILYLYFIGICEENVTESHKNIITTDLIYIYNIIHIPNIYYNTYIYI